MARIVHLSDLHFLAHEEEQRTIFRSLVSAIAVENERRGEQVDLLCITGDVFDSCTLNPARATAAFSELLDRIHEAMGGPVPTIIVPGNHDRRRSGLFLPYSTELFDALRIELAGRAWVHGCEKPFLSEVVPHEVHGLPLWLVAYDSNHLPEGVIGAGGSIRQEDLLRAAAIINGHEPDWPVLFLLHHHLIPTPLTDLGSIETSSIPGPVRWLVEHGLPRILANADREELFMTALGAGTALSTLHAMNRAVLVLHGHKHYATARMLTSTRHGQGDVLIISAGSAGTAQAWQEGVERDSARLWPSFNMIELTDDSVTVDTVAFPWREVDGESLARRPMVSAARRRQRWLPQPVIESKVIDPGPRLEANHARVLLRDSDRYGRRRWDCIVEREVRFQPEHRHEAYVETVDGPPGSELIIEEGLIPVDADVELPAQLKIAPGGGRYIHKGAVARTLSEESQIVGTRQATPYGKVVLMNRYQCAETVLVVKGLGHQLCTAFGSATDLGTGLERPLPVETDAAGDLVRLSLADCPPRTLLRLYWLLEDQPVSRASAAVVPPPSETVSDRPPAAASTDTLSSLGTEV